MVQVRVPYIGACKASQDIRDNVLFAWLVANVGPELLEKLRRSHKSQIEPYPWRSWRDWGLLKDVKYCKVICLNDNVRFGQLNYMLYLFNYPYKAGNLELRRPVVSLYKGK